MKGFSQERLNSLKPGFASEITIGLPSPKLNRRPRQTEKHPEFKSEEMCASNKAA